MALVNAINFATGSLTIDPGASGDSFLQFDINTTGEWRIGVDDTDDSFRISQGSALGTTDTWIMTAAGERTMPLQPAFSAFLASTDADVTGNANPYTIGGVTALTEIFDQGSDFVTSGTFTAPVTGRYHFSYAIRYQQAATGTNADFNLATSNRHYRGWQEVPTSINVGGDFSMNATTFSDMDAADTAKVETNVSGVGADTVDAFGAATDPQTFFSGFLEV